MTLVGRTDAAHMVRYLDGIPPERADAVLEACLQVGIAPSGTVLDVSAGLLPRLPMKRAIAWLERLLADGREPRADLLSKAIDPGATPLERLRSALLAELAGEGPLADTLSGALARSLTTHEATTFAPEIGDLPPEVRPRVAGLAAVAPSATHRAAAGATVAIACRGPAAHRRAWLARSVSLLPRYRPIEVLYLDEAPGADDPPQGTSDLGIGTRLRVLRGAPLANLASAWNVTARASSMPLMCLVVDDVDMEDGCLESLLDTLERNPRAGAVGPLLARPNGTCDEAGRYVFSDGTQLPYGARLPRNDPALASSRAVDALSLACLAIRREALESAGGFDDSLGPGSEAAQGADFCLSLATKGWICLVEPAASAISVAGTLTAGPVTVALARPLAVSSSPTRVLAQRYAGALEYHPRSPGELDSWAWRPLRPSSPRSHRTRRVLVLDPAPGGTRIPSIARCLAENGHAVEVFAFGTPSQHAASHFASPGVRARVAPELQSLPPGDALFAPSLANLLLSAPGAGFDLVYVSAPAVTSAVVEPLARLAEGCAVAIELPPEHPRWLERWIERRVASGARLVLVTKRLAPAMTTPSPAVILPEALDDSMRVPNAAERPVPELAQRSGICFAGRFGWAPLRSAAAWYCREVLPSLGPGTASSIVGPPGSFPLAAASTGPACRVVVTGMPCLPWLEAARAAVIPLDDLTAASWAEVLPALASGTPLVVTPEVAAETGLTGGHDALIASGRDQTAEALLALLEDEQLWLRLHDNGLETARARNHYIGFERAVEELAEMSGLA